ncbi:TPA: hypothetical protein ACUNF5_007399 [Burkholderia orbicola]|uniref:hypothetical protein n=1 Tax=Burkholderia cenocepacia TaxID=95486 RepID=UPI001588AB56|nr:hypothetical protein [Burkholderia cenocepacia]MBN3529929.1 hypothetical protein [Burkholderia cenocepacia]
MSEAAQIEQPKGEKSDHHSGRSTVAWALSALLFLAVIGLCAGFTVIIWPGWSTLTKGGEGAGVFGDAFGGLNTLFTALAFAGLIITIFLQRQQLIDQRKEISSDRKRQNSEWSEEKFFRLLDIYRGALAALKIRTNDQVFSGVDALAHMHSALDEDLRAQGLSASLSAAKRLRRAGVHLPVEDVKAALTFAHFRAIYTHLPRHARYVESFKLLLRHIHESNVDGREKEFYMDVLQAQLTYLELRYIFLIALAHVRDDELRYLLETTGLIEVAKLTGVLQAHREIYTAQWGYKFQPGGSEKPMPMPKEARRKARALFKEIAPYIRERNRATAPSMVSPTTATRGASAV